MTDIIQGSEEWFRARCGKVTASRIADIIAKTKSGYSASRANYKAQLIAERLTQTVADSYTNAAMQWGIDTEPHARAAYEFQIGLPEVIEVGFVDHPSIPMSGASPDGLVGDDGLIEIKCPNTNTHIDTLLTRKIPQKYITQMHWQMICTHRRWCDFVSYDPRMPEHMQLFIERIELDEKLKSVLEEEVEAFLFDVKTTIEKLEQAYG